jgi:Cas7 group CRISPR-associated protein Csh2
MSAKKNNIEALFNRGTGLLVIEVRHSNPNGDPDAESEPRTIDSDGRGLISPVSFKRKARDLVASEDGPVWQEAKRVLNISTNGKGRKFEILESRGRNRDAISKMDASAFSDAYWDGRVFGNTFLENLKDKNIKSGDKDHFITTGVVQFGPGISIASIEIDRLTTTNKSGVQEGKDRGMAPLGWRVVRHGLYVMPFFVNPMMAVKSGCTAEDVDLLKFLIPHTYRNTASAIRPFVEVRHAWYAEHASPLGSCPDSLILDALTPSKKDGKIDQASTSIAEYDIPDASRIPAPVRKRLKGIEDLCLKDWN